MFCVSIAEVLVRHRLPLLIAIAALVTCAGAAPAVAVPAGAWTVSEGQAVAHRHCIARAVPTRSTQPPASSCYSTFAASVRAATSGRVRLPVSAEPGSVTPAQLNAGQSGRRTTYVLSIDFQDSDFGGDSLIWYQSSKCGDFQATTMPTGWNDTISSVIAESGCATTIFWNKGFGSPSYPIGKNGSAASLGTFNDETSSQTWCPTYRCGRQDSRNVALRTR